MNLDERCRRIELLLSDVDGVLTDGGIVLDSQAVETKRFHIRDGMGIHLWQQAGRLFGLVTLRSSQVVKLRAAELGIEIIQQGVDNKLAAVQQILRQRCLSAEQVCYIGDDLPDLPAVRAVGLGVAVADACDELRQAAHHVTRLSGGAGILRPSWPESLTMVPTPAGSETCVSRSRPRSVKPISVTNFGYPQSSRPAAFAIGVVTGRSTTHAPTVLRLGGM